MSWISRLFGRGSHNGDRATPDGGTYVYLRCNGAPHRPCGEPIRVRINARNDLLEEYDAGDADRIAGYTCHKEVLGTWCQQMIHLTIQYDERRREANRTVEGATLIDAAEYERLQQTARNNAGQAE